MKSSAFKTVLVLLAAILAVANISVVLWSMSKLLAKLAIAVHKLSWPCFTLISCLIFGAMFGFAFWAEHRRPQSPVLGHTITDFCITHFRSLLVAVFIATMAPFLNYLALFAPDPYAVVQDVLWTGLMAGFWLTITLVTEFVIAAIVEARPR